MSFIKDYSLYNQSLYCHSEQGSVATTVEESHKITLRSLRSFDDGTQGVPTQDDKYRLRMTQAMPVFDFFYSSSLAIA